MKLLSEQLKRGLLQVEEIQIGSSLQDQFKITLKISHCSFAFEALISFDTSIYNNASSLCQAWASDKCDLKNHKPQWVSVGIDQDSAGSDDKFYTGPIDCNVSNQNITELAINYFKQLKGLTDFGFNPEVVNNLFLVREDKTDQAVLNESFKPWLKFNNLKKCPFIRIDSNKIIKPDTIELIFSVASDYPDQDHYLDIEATVVYQIDHINRTLTPLSITAINFYCHSFDFDADECLILPLGEWVDEVVMEMDSPELIDLSRADTVMKQIISDEVVTQHLTKMCFK